MSLKCHMSQYLFDHTWLQLYYDESNDEESVITDLNSVGNSKENANSGHKVNEDASDKENKPNEKSDQLGDLNN